MSYGRVGNPMLAISISLEVSDIYLMTVINLASLMLRVMRVFLLDMHLIARPIEFLILRLKVLWNHQMWYLMIVGQNMITIRRMFVSRMTFL